MPLNPVKAPIKSVGGFIGGFRYPLKGGFFILRHPSLWAYCIAPVLINVVVLVFFWQWIGDWSTQLLAEHLTGTGWLWDAARTAAGALAFLVRIVATVICFVIVGTLASVPFNDFLSEQTDKLASGWKDPNSFSATRIVRTLTLTVFQEAKRMSVYMILIGILLLASFIPILAPFAVFLKLIVTAIFLAVDYLSYPLERRGALLYREKMRFTRRYLPASLGFGGAMICILLIPIVNFLFLPLGVVGGTLLFTDIMRRYEAEAISGTARS